MTDLRQADQQALEAMNSFLSDDLRPYQAAKVSDALRAALAEPVQDGDCKLCTDGCLACDARRQ